MSIPNRLGLLSKLVTLVIWNSHSSIHCVYVFLLVVLALAQTQEVWTWGLAAAARFFVLFEPLRERAR
ncbi:unnamed protein product [Ectocarpus sp. 6 AP-2014]